ncbi:tol-pal system-associated acyl-CoA thioesterase [soil metagenome]
MSDVTTHAQSSMFVFPVRVYVEDTDFGGIVYHSVFLNYMERCRTEWLNSVNLDILQIGNDGCFFVVRRIEIDYTKPAKLNEKLEVTAQVVQLGRSSLSFFQTVRSIADPTIIYCSATVNLVTVNGNLRPIRIPQIVVEKFL